MPLRPLAAERRLTGAALARRLLTIALAVLAVAHILVISFTQDASLDLPWHLALGDELLQTGRFPLRDRYSYTFAGRPYAYIPWLAELLFAGSYRITGSLVGPMVLRAVVLLGSFYALLRGLRARGVAAPLALAVLLAAFDIARNRLQLRPELFLLPAFTLLLPLLQRSREGQRGALLGVVALLAVYGNVHVTASPLLLALIYAEAGVLVLASLEIPALRTLLGPAPPRRTVALFLLMAALASAATALNPTLMDPLRALRLTTPATVAHIREYAGFAPLSASPAALCYIALALFALLLGISRATLPGALVSAALCLWALRHQRLVGPFALLSAPFVAESLQVALTRVPAARAALWRGLFSAVLCVQLLLGAAMAYGADQIINEVGARFDPRSYPLRAAEYLARTSLPGRVFNTYDFGGYLLWRLGPAHPVLIDGRTSMLYDEALFLSTYVPAQRRARDFQAVTERYGIGHAVLRPFSLGFDLAALPGWSLVHADDHAEVFSRAPLPAGALPYRLHAPHQAHDLLALAGDPALNDVAAEVQRLVQDQPGSVIALRLQVALAAAQGKDAALHAGLAALRAAGQDDDEALLGAALRLAQGRYAEAADALAQQERRLAGLGDGDDQAVERPVDRLLQEHLRRLRLLRGIALARLGHADAQPLLTTLAGSKDASGPALSTARADEPAALLALAELAARQGTPAEADALFDRFLLRAGTAPRYAAQAARVKAARAARGRPTAIR